MTNALSPVLGVRAHDYEGAAPGELFSRIAADGFRAIQLAAPKSFGWAYPLSRPQCAEIQTALQENGLFIAVLGCYVDVATEDAARNAAAVDTFTSALRGAVLTSARCVGAETTHFEGDGAARKAAFDRLTESVMRMVGAAETIGARVGIEPVAAHVLNTPEAAEKLLRRVNSPCLSIIFDPGNLLTPRDARNQKDFLARCDQAFGDRVIAVHVKDAIIQSEYVKPSRPLFEGDLDWSLYLNWAKGKPGLPLLREEAIPARAGAEIARMREMLS